MTFPFPALSRSVPARTSSVSVPSESTPESTAASVLDLRHLPSWRLGQVTGLAPALCSQVQALACWSCALLPAPVLKHQGPGFVPFLRPQPPPSLASCLEKRLCDEMPWRPPPVWPSVELDLCKTALPTTLRENLPTRCFPPHSRAAPYAVCSGHRPWCHPRLLLSHPTFPSSGSHWPNLQAGLKPATISSITSLVQATILPHQDCHCSLPAVLACPLQPGLSPLSSDPFLRSPTSSE